MDLTSKELSNSQHNITPSDASFRGFLAACHSLQHLYLERATMDGRTDNAKDPMFVNTVTDRLKVTVTCGSNLSDSHSD